MLITFNLEGQILQIEIVITKVVDVEATQEIENTTKKRKSKTFILTFRKEHKPR